MDNSRNCRTPEDASLYGRKNVVNTIERETDQLKRAIESQHGGAATMVQSVPVQETFSGQTVWEGVVHIFDLASHPKATRAMRGHHLSREAKSAGSLPFSIFRLSRRQ
ncbi:MAG: hypothetical protein CR217_06490 [Beijerinckiaceae bacterium]|nr:MAG: hypothetical protein CR217_06490 [Beijerinckiaceae bacterium]